jgi:hypothetical protein
MGGGGEGRLAFEGDRFDSVFGVIASFAERMRKCRSLTLFGKTTDVSYAANLKRV